MNQQNKNSDRCSLEQHARWNPDANGLGLELSPLEPHCCAWMKLPFNNEWILIRIEFCYDYLWFAWITILLHHKVLIISIVNVYAFVEKREKTNFLNWSLNLRSRAIGVVGTDRDSPSKKTSFWDFKAEFFIWNVCWRCLILRDQCYAITVNWSDWLPWVNLNHFHGIVLLCEPKQRYCEKNNESWQIWLTHHITANHTTPHHATTNSILSYLKGLGLVSRSYLGYL